MQRNSDIQNTLNEKGRVPEVVAFFEILCREGGDFISEELACKYFFDPKYIIVWDDFEKLVEAKILERNQNGWLIIRQPTRDHLEKIFTT